MPEGLRACPGQRVHHQTRNELRIVKGTAGRGNPKRILESSLPFKNKRTSSVRKYAVSGEWEAKRSFTRVRSCGFERIA